MVDSTTTEHQEGSRGTQEVVGLGRVEEFDGLFATSSHSLGCRDQPLHGMKELQLPGGIQKSGHQFEWQHQCDCRLLDGGIHKYKFAMSDLRT